MNKLVTYKTEEVAVKDLAFLSDVGNQIEILGTAKIIEETTRYFLIYRLYGKLRKIEISKETFLSCKSLFGLIKEADSALIDMEVSRKSLTDTST